MVLVTSLSLCFAKSVWSSEKGVFQLNDGRGHLSAKMRVYYFRPKNFTSSSPILIVLHGNNRTARNYRNYFVEPALQHSVLVLVPKFSRVNYPGSRHFNLGYLQDRDGNFTPKTLWAFPVIDRVFKKAKEVFQFQPSADFFTMLSFFDQYGYSHSPWSPDGNNLVVSGTTEQASSRRNGQSPTGDRVFVLDVAGNQLALDIAGGTLAFWSWN